MISVEHLSRRFGARAVMHDLSFEVAAGGRTALRGPNGSGKTTVLRCVLGTLAPTSGSVLVGGHRAGSIAARTLVGASLSQERSFYLRLTGRQNLVFFAQLRGLSRQDARTEVATLVDELELGGFADQRCDRCSTGMMQQLAFARALLGSPSVLLLDEPTRSLDEDARNRLWRALDSRATAAVLIATHVTEDLGHVHAVVDLGAAT